MQLKKTKTSGANPTNYVLILKLQRQRCSRLERFFSNYVNDNIFFVFETLEATSRVVNFYNAGAVTHDRRIGTDIFLAGTI
jgi:hypothetical protein